MFDDPDALKQRLVAFSGAIFLFGFAFLVLINFIWPGLLLLIWFVSIPLLLAEKGFLYGLWLIAQATIWMIGLPFFLFTRMIWPGILVLSGMSALLVAIAPPDKLDQRHQRLMAERRLGRQMLQKRKRGLAVPPDTDRLVLRDDHDLPGNGWDHTDDIWDSEYEEDETGRLSHDSQD